MTKLYLLLVFALAFGCAPRTYISRAYDFNKLQRIGILAFSSPNNAFDGAENLFAENLLKYGYTVVERAKIEQVLGEQNLGADSYLSPDLTRKIGKVLGVDVLLLGSITSYLPEQKKLAYNINRVNTSEPVFRNEIVKTPEGETIIKPSYAGMQERRERSVYPYEYTIYAQVGVVAKMVDVNTAEIVWVGDDTTEGVSGLDAVSSIAKALIKSFDSRVRAARKKK
ncbi:MAG: CsgG/HfaB family protein [Elusimicrobiota bacterium]|jgi:curli biogenesis system outer membrane secretion channel CsgG|nr:CsgG/HfaB family protein [Elusimicrobiota bacterium]